MAFGVAPGGYDILRWFTAAHQMVVKSVTGSGLPGDLDSQQRPIGMSSRSTKSEGRVTVSTRMPNNPVEAMVRSRRVKLPKIPDATK